MALALFCIVHALLHLRLRNDPLSTFNSNLSWTLILGAAVIGFVYCLMAWQTSSFAAISESQPTKK